MSNNSLINANKIATGGNVTFAGNFTTQINVTGNTNVTLPTSGTLATTTGSVSNADNIFLTDDTTSNLTVYPVWCSNTSGYQPLTASTTKLSFNPSTGNLSATSYTGTWSGSVINLSHGGSNANLTAANGGIVYSTATAMAILAPTATANLPLLSSSNSAPTWGSFALSLGGALTTAGALTTSGAFGVTFTFTDTTSVIFPTSGTLATTGGSISKADSILITDDNASNLTVYPVWVTSNTGYLPCTVSSTKISFNPSNGTLTYSGVNSSAGGRLFSYSFTSSAVNYFTFKNNTTGNDPEITATGADAALNLALKTTNGYVALRNSGSTNAPVLRLYNKDNTQFTGLHVADSAAASATFTIPSADGSANSLMQTNGSGVLSFYLLNNVNAQVGTTYTVVAADYGKTITFSNASPVTVTLPQQSTTTTAAGFFGTFVNLGAGLVTIVKEGAETLIGNTTLAQNATSYFNRVTTASWSVFGGTSTVNFEYSISPAAVTATQAYTFTQNAASAGTILSCAQAATSFVTAGTYTVAINGVTVTGLSAITNSTSKTVTTATAANTFAVGDVITLTLGGTVSTGVGYSATINYSRTF